MGTVVGDVISGEEQLIFLPLTHNLPKLSTGRLWHSDRPYCSWICSLSHITLTLLLMSFSPSASFPHRWAGNSASRWANQSVASYSARCSSHMVARGLFFSPAYISPYKSLFFLNNKFNGEHKYYEQSESNPLWKWPLPRLMFAIVYQPQSIWAPLVLVFNLTLWGDVKIPVLHRHRSGETSLTNVTEWTIYGVRCILPKSILTYPVPSICPKDLIYNLFHGNIGPTSREIGLGTRHVVWFD
jgi:hypothetical protein